MSHTFTIFLWALFASFTELSANLPNYVYKIMLLICLIWSNFHRMQEWTEYQELCMWLIQKWMFLSTYSKKMKIEMCFDTNVNITCSLHLRHWIPMLKIHIALDLVEEIKKYNYRSCLCKHFMHELTSRFVQSNNFVCFVI